MVTSLINTIVADFLSQAASDRLTLKIESCTILILGY